MDTLAKSISSVEARWRFLGRGSFLLAFGLGFIGNHRDCNIKDLEHGEHLFFKFKVILARTRGSKGPEYIIDQRFLHAVNMYIMKNIISLVLKKLRGGGGGSIEYFLQTSKRHYTGAVPWQKLSATSNGTEKWSPGDRNSDSL